MTHEGHLGQTPAQGGFLLLFAPGDRPSSADVDRALGGVGQNSAAAVITHRPDAGEGWLELLASGMVFDLSALIPAEAAFMPRPRGIYGIDQSLIHASFEAIRLVPGPHIASGGAMLPVVRVMADLVGVLARSLGARGVFWNPAETFIDVPYFCRVVENWLAGGAFPALGLVAVEQRPEGGMASFGLDFFVGQEVIVGSEPGEERTDAVKLAVRAINDLVCNGPVGKAEWRRSADDEAILLSASRDGRLVSARRER